MAPAGRRRQKTRMLPFKSSTSLYSRLFSSITPACSSAAMVSSLTYTADADMGPVKGAFNTVTIALPKYITGNCASGSSLLHWFPARPCMHARDRHLS